MGQSDTESTSSSMRGNPGSPRDISVLLDDGREEIAAILNTAFITPEGPSRGTDGHTSEVTMETPKRSSSNPQIPVIDLTSPDGSESSTVSSEERNTIGLPEDFILRSYGPAAARLHPRLQLPRYNRVRLDRSRVNIGRLRRRAGGITFSRGSPRPASTQQEPVAEDAGAVGGAACPPVINMPNSDSPIVIDLEEGEEAEASAPNRSHTPERFNVFERMRHVNTSRHNTLMEVARSRRMREGRFARRSRHCLDHDELFARQLQEEELNQELDIGQTSSVPLHHVPPDLPAAPLPPHAHPYRRRTYFRHPSHTTSTMPQDFLLPFVSVVSVPPPLHHYGMASRLEHMGDPEDYEALWNLTERLGPAKARGLSKEVIDRIPSFRYSAQSKDSSNGKCVVCMMDYSNREKLRRLPCSHDFHSKCVDRWLRSNRTCPVCREVVGS